MVGTTFGFCLFVCLFVLGNLFSIQEKSSSARNYVFVYVFVG